jgi:hypothetical protein
VGSMKPLFRVASSVLVSLVLNAVVTAGSVAKVETCPPADLQAVSGAVRAMFAALSARDAAGVRATLSRDFYAFDGGKRFDGMALSKLVSDAQAAGKVYVWSVDQADIHIDCDRAWIAYVNHGSITDATGSKPLTWLESANLRFTDGRWRIVFLHSTRVPVAP